MEARLFCMAYSHLKNNTLRCTYAISSHLARRVRFFNKRRIVTCKRSRKERTEREKTKEKPKKLHFFFSPFFLFLPLPTCGCQVIIFQDLRLRGQCVARLRGKFRFESEKWKKKERGLGRRKSLDSRDFPSKSTRIYSENGLRDYIFIISRVYM